MSENSTLDEIAAAYEARVASVPEAARRFASETWGETWSHAEMGSLLDFAAMIASAPVPDQSGVGGNVGRQTGACLTAPGSHPSDQAASHLGGNAVSIPSRGLSADERLKQIEALEDWLVQNAGIGTWAASTTARALLRREDSPLVARSPAFAAAIPSRGELATLWLETCGKFITYSYSGNRPSSVRLTADEDQIVFGPAPDDDCERFIHLAAADAVLARVSDRSGEAVETTGSTEGESTATSVATPKSPPPPPHPDPKTEARKVLEDLTEAELKAAEKAVMAEWQAMSEQLLAEHISWPVSPTNWRILRAGWKAIAQMKLTLQSERGDLE